MSADIKSLQKIKTLRTDAARIGEFHDMFNDKYEANSRCDKKGYGFGKDNRFAVFSIKTSFDCWAGYYGDSSCSSPIGFLDRSLVERAFVKAIDRHQKQLFASAAEIMREEASSLTADASREIEALQKLLEEATADPEASE